MKYLKQFLIIIAISLAGELLHAFLPFPIPASIYGIVLLFVLLCTHVIPLNAVKETAHYLVEIMPVMFIPAAVGLIGAWDVLKDHLLVYAFIAVVSTVLVMGIAGTVTQLVIRKGKKK